MTGPDASVATASEIAIAVSEKRIRARAVIEAALARIKRVDPQTNAFTDVVTERALAKAAALDDKINKGEKVGALGFLARELAGQVPPLMDQIIAEGPTETA